MSAAAEDLLETWNGCGYYRLVGMRVVRADDEGSRLELEVRPEHLQAYGTAHGGVTAGLLDAAMGLAVIARVPPEDGCATVEMSLRFVAPARPGPLAAEGRVLHLTNPEPAALTDLTERIRARGRPVERLPYGEWVRRLIAFATTNPAHPITPFVPLFVDRAEGSELTISEMYFRPTFPQFSRDGAERALTRAGVRLPPVDAELLDFYLDRLEASGQLEHVA